MIGVALYCTQCDIENKRVNKIVLHWLRWRLCFAMMEAAPGKILIHQYFTHNNTDCLHITLKQTVSDLNNKHPSSCYDKLLGR